MLRLLRLVSRNAGGRGARRDGGAGRQLHHDDVGAELGEDGRGHRPREPLGEIEDADAGERARPLVAAPRRAAPRSPRRAAAPRWRPARRAPHRCARRGAAPRSGFRAGVRDSFGTARGRDELPARLRRQGKQIAPRACTCSSAMMSSTERIAVPATPHAVKRASTSARSCRAIHAPTSASDAARCSSRAAGVAKRGSLRRVRRLDGLAEAHERLIAGARHRDPSPVAGRVHVGGDHGGRLGAHARGHGAGPVVLDDHLLLHPQADLVEPEVDDLSPAAAARVEDRHQEPIAPEEARPAVQQRQRDGNRRAIGEARRELHAREGLRDAVVAVLAGERARLAEGRDAQDGEPRIDAVERSGARPAASSRPGPRSSTSASADARSGASQPPRARSATSAAPSTCRGSRTGSRGTRPRRRWRGRAPGAAIPRPAPP